MQNYQNDLQMLGMDPYQTSTLIPIDPYSQQMDDPRRCGRCGGFRCGGFGCGGFRCGGFRCGGCFGGGFGLGCFGCFGCFGGGMFMI